VKISDILRHKAATSGTSGASSVVTVSPAGLVTEMLSTLAEHGIGALVVVDAAGGVLGIVSERDVVRRLNERGADLLQATVDDIMTTDVLTCEPGDDVDAIASTMTERRIRHMPVCEQRELIGIVSIGDVVYSRMRQLEQDRGQLEQYITG
jgi:CBS domain-containing protein